MKGGMGSLSFYLRDLAIQRGVDIQTGIEV